jgi:hypothetical protein
MIKIFKNNFLFEFLKENIKVEKKDFHNILKITVSYLILNSILIFYENKFNNEQLVFFNLISLIILSLEFFKIETTQNNDYDIFLVKFYNIPFITVFLLKHFVIWVKYVIFLGVFNIISLYIFCNLQINYTQYLNMFFIHFNVIYDFSVINFTMNHFFNKEKNESFLLLLILLPSYIPAIIITIRNLNLNIVQIITKDDLIISCFYSIILSTSLILFLKLYYGLFKFN